MDTKRFLSPGQAASETGVKLTTIYQWVHKGKLPTYPSPVDWDAYPARYVVDVNEVLALRG